jgi:peptide/nickel transport system substrate-binding protein
MQQVAGLLFNGLVGLDEDARPVPELASDWEIADGGRNYRFFLRPNVRWHDGMPLTAADVKFSYEAALVRYHARTQSSLAQALEQPCTQAPAAPSCPSIQATEATAGSPATVVFRFAQPYAALLQQLTHTDGAIIPKHIWDRAGTLPTPGQPWPTGQNPVATGPFRFVSHSTSEIVFERNTEFFRPGLPYFDRVVHRAVTSPAESLRRGEVDWIWGAPGQAIPGLRADPNVRVFTGSMSAGGSTNCVLKIPINLWARGATPAQVRAGTAPPHPILSDQRVRQAVAHALNREEYVGSVLRLDGGRVANAPIHSGMPFAHAPQQFPTYDLDEARRLLGEAGWTGDTGIRSRGGAPLSIDTYGFAGVQTDLMNRMKQDLAAVGIDLRVNTIDPGAMNARYANRDYDTLVFSNCQATDPEIGVRRLYHSSAITGAPFTNGAGYRNPDVDRLFEEGARGFPADRTTAYRQAQQQIARDLPYLWLLETVSNRAWRSNCEGFMPYTGHFAETAFCRR